MKAEPSVYPEFDQELVDAFRHETERFVASTLDEDRSVLDLLGADYTYLNERLARHYGVPGVYGSRFHPPDQISVRYPHLFWIRSRGRCQ